jgi:hypothetical protein
MNTGILPLKRRCPVPQCKGIGDSIETFKDTGCCTFCVEKNLVPTII